MDTPNFDWLSDLGPLFRAQESWFDGSYQRYVNLQVPLSGASPFSISCGGGLLAEHISRFRFTPAIIQQLGQVTDERGRSVFQESFLNHLQRLRLRIQVQAAPEGTLLLPGEPLVIVQGAYIQALLLESALRLLIWDSTHWATKAAFGHWKNRHFSEQETPAPPSFVFRPEGWKERAVYVGGGGVEQAQDPASWPGMQELLHESQQPLSQIRRLYKGEQALGDVWMTSSHEDQAGVSRTHIDFYDRLSGQQREILMTRFQNLYQPLLLKGHPVLVGSSLDYLRQRTWKQLEAFSQIDLSKYPSGWYLG